MHIYLIYGRFCKGKKYMKNVIQILKSLFSNQAAIDNRKNKWYLTLITFIFIVFLPWIPYLSSGYTANTASLFTQTASSNYDIDKGFKATIVKDYFKNGVVIKKNSNNEYYFEYDFTNQYTESAGDFDNEYLGTNTKELYKGTFSDTSGGTNHISSSTTYVKDYTSMKKEYYFDCISVSNSDVIDPSKSSSSTSTSSTIEYEDNGYTYFLENFYLPELSNTEEKYMTYLNNFVSSVVLNVDSTGKANSYPHSYAIWGQNFILAVVYPLKSSKSSLSVKGSYSGVINYGFNGADIQAGTSFYKYLSEDGKLSITDTYTKGFAEFLNQAGKPAYIRSTWMNIGILSAVVVGTVLVASLLLLFFFKRKTSLYRESNYLNAISSAVYFTSTGALFGFVLGFFLTQWVYFAIIGITLIRLIFGSNKICPPPAANGQSGSKPLYQARS